MGEIRPVRLLPKASRLWNGLAVNACDVAEVTGLTRVGDQEVIAMATSTKTFVAEGLLTHNSPIMLGQHRKTQQQMAVGKPPFDWMVLGHWHQYFCGRGIIVNGALKGFDEFAYVNNFRFEPAQQAFWLTTPEHGVAFSAPIFCEDKKAEGW